MVEPVLALIDRVVPGASSHFVLSINPGLKSTTTRLPCFSAADAPHGRVAVSAGDISTLSAGVHYYLSARSNLTIGWTRGGGSDLTLGPGGWPSMSSTGGNATRCRATQWSYFMNVCTHSYSLVWYDWAEWQRLLDWMALSGINLFLAMTGQEEVAYRVFSRLGLHDSEIRGWFNGPAFLTWSRGQNEYGSGIAGPLPRSFMKSQFELQQKILSRARELGLIGQLPGFQGNVPLGLRDLLSDSNITQQGMTGWMDSLDPNFGRVADMWMGELGTSFGNQDHWYQLDGYFNGGTAPWLGRKGRAASIRTKRPRSSSHGRTRASSVSADPTWHRRGLAAYRGLNRTDPGAVWSFQGFAFEHWEDDD